jgi:2-hydroxychromene-2-carboxylate isomerase
MAGERATERSAAPEDRPVSPDPKGNMAMPEIAFWYDFASTYSYLSAMRIEPLAKTAGVTVAYRPFLLGPIFKAQGLTSSPFSLNPVKGRYMARDIARIAAARGNVFHIPDPFPAHSLAAARIALVAEAEGWIAAFTRAVFVAEFEQRADISSVDVLGPILSGLGHDPARILAAAGSAETKAALRTRTDQAAQKGIFGAPTFVTADGELFWGDDRLEQALDWARK